MHFVDVLRNFWQVWANAESLHCFPSPADNPSPRHKYDDTDTITCLPIPEAAVQPHSDEKPLSRRTPTDLGERAARQQRGDGHEQRNGYPDHEPHATERQLKQEEREVKNSLLRVKQPMEGYETAQLIAFVYA